MSAFTVVELKQIYMKMKGITPSQVVVLDDVDVRHDHEAVIDAFTPEFQLPQHVSDAACIFDDRD